MLEKSQSDLRRSIRRKLALRLLLACGPLALLASAGVFYLERDRFGEEVRSYTLTQAALFNAEQGGMLDDLEQIEPETLDRALTQFAERHAGGRLGRFEAVTIHLESGELVGSFIRDDAAERETVGELLGSSRFPAVFERWSVVERRAGEPYLLVQMPLTSSDFDRVGWVRGVFAPSDGVVDRVSRRALRAAMGVLLVMGVLAASLWPLVSRLVDRLAKLSGSLLEANLGTLDALGRALAKRDGDTEEHSMRVTLLAVRLAEDIGVDRHGIQSLIKGAALHDVGKIAIRDEILLKPGKLTDEEYEVMKSHVAHGIDIVTRSSWLEPAGAVVENHHERFGGGGYLRGLEGTEIPLAARIFSIVDVFDAMASVRPYKEAIGFDRTMESMREERGTQFDPDLLDAFERIAPELYRRYYRGSGEALEAELDRVVDRYFSGGLDAVEVV